MDITPLKKMIQVEETQYAAAVSSSVAQRIGSSINFINSYQLDTIDFKVNGPYNLGPLPNLQFDGIVTFPFAFEIVNAFIYTGPTVASGGTTELDIKWKPYASGSYSSIFTTTPKFNSSAAASDGIHDGSTKTGFTAPVLSTTQFAAWDLLKLDILQAVTGTQAGCGIKLFWRPR
jgi:hypothetical protein